MNIEERLRSTPSYEHWQRIGLRHHHGIAIPLFALRSEKCTGIGEFPDLLPLIDWCQELGLDVIQLLPLNDTGLGTSPYSGISAFALHPLYLRLADLPLVERVPLYLEKLTKIAYWNRTERVKYHIVRELKFAFLREYFEATFQEFANQQHYRDFVDQNEWLHPYALFRVIKEEQFWKDWERWPIQFREPENTQKLLDERKEECDFYRFMQFHCFEQLSAVKNAATAKNVMIKGDLPILLSRDSADVWYYRNIFNLSLSAGSPPDMYAREGQNWGFPLYNWEAQEANDFAWWRARLRLAAKFYHLYRLDHVVGFFRIWAIPHGHKATEGHYIPHHENDWVPHGRRLMELMLKAAPIFPIGEDLGTVPPVVRECLTSLGIPGTKVIRWERDWHGDRKYIPYSQYNPISMTTVSTHDSDTLQLWWRHSPKEAKLFCEFKGWDYRPFLSKERQEEILKDSHHSASLFHINLLQEYLALFPELVSTNPNFERINVPGKFSDRNWTYRTHTFLEKIVSHDSLKEAMREILKG